MQILILFTLGIALGLIASITTGSATQQSRFNDVRCGVLGALAGGLLVSRAITGEPVSRDDIDIGSLLIGALSAMALLAPLAAWRRRAG